MTVLCLAGTGRNGATLLSRVLAQVPGVVAVGELGYLWDRGLVLNQECGCGAQVRECSFWVGVGDKAFGGWDSVDLDHVLRLKRRVQRERYLPLLMCPEVWSRFREDVDAYCRYTSALYNGIVDSTGADLVVDSMKELPYVYLQRHTPGIDLRILHIVRDSRGVAYSWTKHVQRGVSVGDPDLLRRPPAQSARRWIATNAMFHILEGTNVPYMFLKYESFIRHPLEASQRILDFAGVNVSGSDLAFINGSNADMGVTHTVEGSRTRFGVGPVDLRIDDEWRTELATRDRRAVTGVTWPLLLAYGYRLRR